MNKFLYWANLIAGSLNLMIFLTGGGFMSAIIALLCFGAAHIQARTDV